MVGEKCSRCGFEFEDGIYLMKNQTDYLCIFCLKKIPDINIGDLFDNRQLRIIGDILDREGCIKLFSDLL